jgi:hypothetical protein
MKNVSKFQLEIPLAWQGCVAPGCVILLGLGFLFPLVNSETYLISGNFHRDDPCQKS